MASCTSVFLSFLLVPWLLWKKYIKQENSPNLPPRPPKLPIIGNLHQVGELPHRSLLELSKKYGPIMLLQYGHKKTLVISSADTAREVLQTHDLSFCSRPSLVGTKRLSYNYCDFGFGPYGDYSKEMRKICILGLLSSRKVQSFKPVREEEVGNLMKSVSDSVSSPLNLTEMLFSLTIKITCRVAFGKSYLGKEDFIVGKLSVAIFEAMNVLGGFTATDLYPFFGRIYDLFTGFRRRLEKCFDAFDAFYQQLIDEHLDSTRKMPEHEDIIDVLLRLQKDQAGVVRLTMNHIKAILMNVMLAGVESSAITMVWAMAELARKPELMKRVQEEVRSCIGEKGKVEESDIDRLRYLKMVVKETLRLHPPGPLLLPRESMNHCKIKGYDIYPKTRVLVNVWAIGRSSDYWDNPDEFIPERFMKSTIDFKGNDFEYLPFGSGRRICPGITMGVATVELGLANLLYGFNWGSPPGVAMEHINMEEVAGLTARKKYPLLLVPMARYWCQVKGVLVYGHHTLDRDDLGVTSSSITNKK